MYPSKELHKPVQVFHQDKYYTSCARAVGERPAPALAEDASSSISNPSTTWPKTPERLRGAAALEPPERDAAPGASITCGEDAGLSRTSHLGPGERLPDMAVCRNDFRPRRQPSLTPAQGPAPPYLIPIAQRNSCRRMARRSHSSSNHRNRGHGKPGNGHVQLTTAEEGISGHGHFGTGYTSLPTSEAAIDILKIDRSFVQTMLENPTTESSGHHRPGPDPQPAHRGRRRGNARAAGRPAETGLRPGPGLPAGKTHAP